MRMPGGTCYCDFGQCSSVRIVSREREAAAVSWMQALVQLVGSRLCEGTYLLDFGQNHSGRLRLLVPAAEAGHRVRVRHAEVLQDGQLYTRTDRKSTRLNSSHVATSYAVFCLKKQTRPRRRLRWPCTNEPH